MGRHRLIVWFLVAALTLPVVPGTAEEEEQEGLRHVGGLTFVDEIALTIANLVVYVTDKKGRAITNLTQDDFEIFQDGDPKQISNFKLYTAEVVRSELGVTTGLEIPEQPRFRTLPPLAGPQPVHLVLYIDNQNLDPLDRNRVLSQTRDFVRTSLHPPAQMMVVAYQRSFEVLQDFTSDPSEVMKAMRVVRTYTGGRTERDSARSDIVDKMQRLSSERRAGSTGSMGDPSNDREWNEIYHLIDNYAKESVNDLQFTLDSLRQIITSLTGLPGKKGVIYVSNGLPMIPGMELFYEASKGMNDSTILSRMFEFDRSADLQAAGRDRQRTGCHALHHRCIRAESAGNGIGGVRDRRRPDDVVDRSQQLHRLAAISGRRNRWNRDFQHQRHRHLDSSS